MMIGLEGDFEVDWRFTWFWYWKCDIVVCVM